MDNQYPIGRWELPDEITKTEIDQWINDIEALPGKLRMLLSDIHDGQLEETYRDGSWNIRQLLHHMADSHLHGYIRTKLILTEDNPVVSTFNENEWVDLKDSEVSYGYALMMVEGIHKRWAYLLKSLQETDFDKVMMHPDNGQQSLKTILCLYAWHGNHHLEHIKIALRKSNEN